MAGGDPYIVHQLPNGITRHMGSKFAKAQLARSKGGRRVHELGKASGCFTSDTGRKAARRLWDRHKRLSKRIGRRLGYRSKHVPGVNRAGLRALYVNHPTAVAFYMPANGTWWGKLSEGVPYRITERTALRRLGHLPYPRKHPVPGMVFDRHTPGG